MDRPTAGRRVSWASTFLLPSLPSPITCRPKNAQKCLAHSRCSNGPSLPISHSSSFALLPCPFLTERAMTLAYGGPHELWGGSCSGPSAPAVCQVCPPGPCVPLWLHPLFLSLLSQLHPTSWPLHMLGSLRGFLSPQTHPRLVWRSSAYLSDLSFLSGTPPRSGVGLPIGWDAPSNGLRAFGWLHGGGMSYSVQ